MGGIPIVGRVAAGSPILAVENRDGYLNVPADFGPRDKLLAVRVQGSSMRDAGILDGDLAVVLNADCERVSRWSKRTVQEWV